MTYSTLFIITVLVTFGSNAKYFWVFFIHSVNGQISTHRCDKLYFLWHWIYSGKVTQCKRWVYVRMWTWSSLETKPCLVFSLVDRQFCVKLFHYLFFFTSRQDLLTMCAKTKEEEMMVSKKSVFCRDCPQGKLAPRNWLFFCLFYFLSLQLKASCDLHASSKVQNKMSKI